MQFVAVVCSLCLGGWILYANRFFYHDDAYITLRYALNVLAGHGVVWNAGEYVQGYTNFLHLVLVSGLGTAGLDLVWSSRFVGMLALGALMLAFPLFLRGFSHQSLREKDLWHVPVILTLSSAPLIVWSIGGLESTLFALLATAGCLLFTAALDQPANRRLLSASGICLALAYLTHPNALVFIGVSGLWLLITWKARPIRNALAFAVPCVFILAAYTLWQFFYYGDIVPNTFYAKAGNFSAGRLVTGLRYFAEYALQPSFLPILVAAALAYTLSSGKCKWHSKLTYLALIVFGYVSFIVFIGGDHMPVFRLFLPLIPLLSYLLFLLLSSAIDTSNRTAVLVTTALALFLACLQAGQLKLNPGVEDKASFVGTVVGKYVAKSWPQGSLVALNTAGSTPYYAPGLSFIDMLGLNDRHIARRIIRKIEMPWQTAPGHLKGDGDYVLSREPDFIIVGPAEGRDISEPWFLSDLEMGRNPLFARSYEKQVVTLNLLGEVDPQGVLPFTYYQRINR